jgi:hypothetical protein
VGARRAKAAVALGAVVAMLPARWAAARAPECESPPAAAPANAAPPAQAADDETPARRPRKQWRTSVDSGAPTSAAPRLLVDPLTIDGAAFYEAVGRPDLASSYRMRHGLSVASWIVGGVSLGVGAFAWVLIRTVEAAGTGIFCTVGIVTETGNPSACQKPDETLWVPDLMMAGGLALIVAPAFWSNDPVSPEEKEELARDIVARARPERGVMWSFAPAPGGQGGTLSLSGRF